MSQTTGSKQRNDERLFFYAATIMALLIGAGFCLLLFALNSREQTQTLPVEHSEATVIPPDHPRQLVNFSLTDRTGRTVTRSELAGQFLVVDFLFTSCSLTCPAVNQNMAQIQQLAANQPDVRLVSLTVDPRDDTPAVLAKYGERFGADTNRWLFLTGDRSELYGLIGTSFLAPDTDGQFAYMPGNFAHTERIVVVDPRGQVQAYFDGLNDHVASAVLAEINRLREKNSSNQKP